jgi:hypothetical protein
MYGASWYLALVYLNRGEMDKARALTLNGAFLQECYHSSFEHIVELCGSDYSNSIEENRLPYFSCGFFAVRAPGLMNSFLQSKLPKEYQHMMSSFASMSSRGSVMGFIDQISDDWNDTPKSSRHRTRSTDDEETISLVVGGETYDIGASTPLRMLFNEYADKNEVSLKSLRFSYAGKTIFLSSVGNKTPMELGLADNDTIEVSNNELLNQSIGSPDSQQSTSKKSGKSKGKKSSPKRTKGKNKKQGSTKIIEPVKTLEAYKIGHSKMLTKLFEEAEPSLKAIRQELNLLSLERQQPKEKSKGNELTEKCTLVPNPSTYGLGGKAGKTCFDVNVGEVANLYKSSKSVCIQPSSTSKLDLHGCTKDEALEKLDQSLQEWNDAAMHSPYPFVLPVSIVCGGGSQVLSETVEKWIKEHRNVSNAPKTARRKRFNAMAA